MLTGRENLALVATLRHVTDAAATADAMLQRFALTEAGDRPASTYSGGMRRRLDIEYVEKQPALEEIFLALTARTTGPTEEAA